MFAFTIDGFAISSNAGAYFGYFAVSKHHAAIFNHLPVAHMYGGIGKGNGLVLRGSRINRFLCAGRSKDAGRYAICGYLFIVNFHC